MSKSDVFFGKAGEPVPIVDVTDIKVMRAHFQELKAQHPGGVAVEVGIWKRLCIPARIFQPSLTVAACWACWK
jgi:hypothetical protein